jgi:hypothetical protein
MQKSQTKTHINSHLDFFILGHAKQNHKCLDPQMRSNTLGTIPKQLNNKLNNPSIPHFVPTTGVLLLNLVHTIQHLLKAMIIH